MAVAIASQIGIHVGGQPLFDDVSFRLTNRERMTLSGRNGAGKSTLLRILAAELLPDSGKLSLRRGARVALHDQRPPRERAISLGDYVLSARAEMIALEAELERLEQVMSAGDHDEVTLESYSNAQQKLETAGGYRWRDDVFAVLRGLGFEAEPEMTERPLSTFSGGELTRASLARALAAGPDLLLLDEPTNHLDIPSLEWLEDHLQGLEAAIVLVAHDRWFLEAVGTSVLELEAGRARFFSGPWHAWRKEKAAREIALGKAIERQTVEIERMERFVERFRYKATKARQAQARIKQIEKLKANAVSHDPRDQRALRFSFATPERAGRFPLKVESARIEVGARVLLEQVTLRLERGEHAVLVGPNGAGKTTLIDTLAGRREPTGGVVKLGHNASLGYLSQHADTAAGTGTVLEAAQRGTGLTPQKVRDLLGHFMFSGDEVENQLTDISGGEQRRLSLAILVASGANVLILDEPTNHLDLESREALEDALTGFEGALLLVSHDRALLEAVGSRTFAIEDGDLHSYQMGWAEYQRTVQEREATEKDTARAADRTSASSSANGKRSTAPRGPSKNALKKIASLERQIEQAEQALATLEEELSDPAAWASPGSSDRSTERHRELKQRIEELYDSWGAAGGSADSN